MVLAALPLLLVTVWVTSVAVETTLLDLTHDLTNDTIIWPTGQWHFEFHRLYAAKVDNYWVEFHQFLTGEHVGTHMDAPRHFYETGWTIDQIPPERFIAPAVVIDIQDRVAQDKDAQVTRDDLLAWEVKYGALPTGAVVLQCSGWDRYWGNETEYFGNNRGDALNYHFPGFHEDAVLYLAQHGGVGIGSDTISIDAGSNSDRFPAHQVMCSHSMWGLENLKGVCRLPAQGATIYALPLKIRGGSGCPSRVLARFGEEGCGATAGATTARARLGVGVFTLGAFLSRYL